MFNNVALDVFIGLIFVFLLYSLLATIVQEMIATRLAFRAKVLEKAIIRMLEDGKSTFGTGIQERLKSFGHLLGRPNLLKNKSIAPWFYAHPLIKYLGEDNTYSKPAYLSAQNFSKVIIDLLKGFGKIDTNETQTINDSINNETIYKLPIDVAADSRNRAIQAIIYQQKSTLINASDHIKINSDTALFLKSLWLESAADVEKFKIKLETWFDDTMERCSGWYKRYTQVVLFVVGLIIAVSFNVDTIAIHRVLSKDDHVRDQIVQLAVSKQQQYGEIIKSLDSTKGSDASLSRTDVLNSADSSYIETYRMLSEDASAAGSILGLGRPWKDTIRMCRDSLNDDFQTRLSNYKKNITMADSLKLVSDSITKMTSRIDTSTMETKGTNSSLFRKLDSANKSLLAQIAPLNVVTLKKEFSRMTSLAERCYFIKSKTKGKIFVYAPNQNGNWETLFGWLITALAICLGAPFWFDLLNKLFKLRGTGTRIDSSGSSNTAPAGSTQANAPIIINTNQGKEAVG
jgi:hypothetical protein